MTKLGKVCVQGWAPQNISALLLKVFQSYPVTKFAPENTTETRHTKDATHHVKLKFGSGIVISVAVQIIKKEQICTRTEIRYELRGIEVENGEYSVADGEMDGQEASAKGRENDSRENH